MSMTELISKMVILAARDAKRGSKDAELFLANDNWVILLGVSDRSAERIRKITARPEK